MVAIQDLVLTFCAKMRCVSKRKLKLLMPVYLKPETKLSSPFYSFAAMILRYVSQEFTPTYEPTIGRIHNYNAFITFVFMSYIELFMICKNRTRDCKLLQRRTTAHLLK